MLRKANMSNIMKLKKVLNKPYLDKEFINFVSLSNEFFCPTK